MLQDTIQTATEPMLDRPDDTYIDEPNPEKVAITDENFSEYFHDVRWNQPEEGQVMARFRGRAQLVDGQLKNDLVQVLLNHERGGDSANQIMRKIGCASERDSIEIPLQIAADLASGMTIEQVMEKVYEYDIEMFYYTNPEYVQPDKHWDIIRLIGMPSKEGKISVTSDVWEKIRELEDTYESDSSSKEDHEHSRRDRPLGEDLG